MYTNYRRSTSGVRFLESIRVLYAVTADIAIQLAAHQGAQWNMKIETIYHRTNERTKEGSQPWMVCVVVLRELLITGLRSFLEGSGVKFGADWLGKIKMWLQCVALIAIFLTPMFPADTTAQVICADLRNGFIYAMVGATALSGCQYLWRAAALLTVKS